MGVRVQRGITLGKRSVGSVTATALFQQYELNEVAADGYFRRNVVMGLVLNGLRNGSRRFVAGDQGAKKATDARKRIVAGRTAKNLI